jgi:hypothetical protein
VSRTARIAPIGLAALTAAALGSATPVLAFDKVDHLQPVQAGRGYVYFVREADVRKQPVAGRTVTVKVGTVPGPGATVAPADAGGHPTGPAGGIAAEASGADGLAYFVLRTSTVAGDNEFTWSDATWTGQVLVTGLAPSPSPVPAAAGSTHGGSSGGAATVVATAARLPGRGFPPLAAGLVAMGVVWAALPALLRRRRRRAAVGPDLSTTGEILSARLPRLGLEEPPAR